MVASAKLEMLVEIHASTPPHKKSVVLVNNVWLSINLIFHESAQLVTLHICLLTNQHLANCQTWVNVSVWMLKYTPCAINFVHYRVFFLFLLSSWFFFPLLTTEIVSIFCSSCILIWNNNRNSFNSWKRAYKFMTTQFIHLKNSLTKKLWILR